MDGSDVLATTGGFWYTAVKRSRFNDRDGRQKRLGRVYVIRGFRISPLPDRCYAAANALFNVLLGRITASSLSRSGR